ncbi:MAG: hypothetical protein ABIS21_05220, partial [Acidimicrobiales bacterium]
AVAITVTLLGACSGSREQSTPPLPTSTTRPATATSTPNESQNHDRPTAPAAPANPTAAAAAAQVPMLDREGAATHTHTQLNVTIAGEEVAIPSDLGIDDNAGKIAALHTHDASGLIHVESPQAADTYTVAQLLVLWGIQPDRATVCTAFGLPTCQITLDGRSVIDRAALDVVLIDEAVIRLELRPADVA